MFPDKLKKGDEIRIIAPSTSLYSVHEELTDRGYGCLFTQGFKVTYSKHCREINEFQSSSIKSRVDDIHEAFADPNVKMLLSCTGGFQVNQILDCLDYDLIRANPKFLCGSSDFTALLNAVYAKTGLVTYLGADLCSFIIFRGYTIEYFLKCVMQEKTVLFSPEEKYSIIQEGICEGEILGGNLTVLHLLRKTPYIPKLRNKVLFIEAPDFTRKDFFRFRHNLRVLLKICGTDTIKGIVFSRFDESQLNDAMLRKILKGKISPDIPVISGVNFGRNSLDKITFPIGGKVSIQAVNETVAIKLIQH